MSEYRAYRLTRENHIMEAVIIDADDDESAIHLASELNRGHDVEVWQRARFVATIERKPVSFRAE